MLMRRRRRRMNNLDLFRCVVGSRLKEDFNINWPLRQTIGSLTELIMDDHQSFFNFLRMSAEMFDELLRRVGPRCHKTNTSCLTTHRPHASVASSPDLFFFFFRRPSRASCSTWCTTFSVPRQTCLLPSLFFLPLPI